MAGQKDKKKKDPIPYIEYEKELQRQIREQAYHHVTLITGREDYLRHHNSEALCRAILGDGDRMNYAHFQGSGIALGEVLSLAGTLPFLAEHRVLFLEETGLFAQAGAEAEQLAAALEEIPETTYYVFCESAVNGSTKLSQTVKKLGWVMQCDTPDARYLGQFVREIMTQRGMKITPGAVSLLLDYAGDDLLNIRNESTKLADYCYGRQEATEEDVRVICSARVKDRIFDMISAIAAGRRETALGIYMDLLRLQTAPQVILSLMFREFNQLLQAMELAEKKVETGEAAKLLGLKYGVLQYKIMPLVRGKSSAKLQAALQACVQANMDYRSGKISAQLAVEKLIIRYSAPGALQSRQQ